MKITDFWEAYYSHTGKASDVARQLCFAGLGLIWLVLGNGQVDQVKIPEELWPCAFLFILALAVDLLQYVIASVVWGVFCFLKERSLKSPSHDPAMEAPRYINVPANLAFLLKLAFVGWAYWQLLWYLWRLWIVR